MSEWEIAQKIGALEVWKSSVVIWSLLILSFSCLSYSGSRQLATCSLVSSGIESLKITVARPGNSCQPSLRSQNRLTQKRSPRFHHLHAAPLALSLSLSIGSFAIHNAPFAEPFMATCSSRFYEELLAQQGSSHFWPS